MAETENTQNAILEQIEARSPQSMHPILEAAFKYQKQIIAGVAVIVAAAAVYAGINTYNQHALTTAQDNLGAILVKAKGEEKVKQLEELLGMVPSDAKPAVQLEIAQACMTIGQYDKATAAWNELVGETDNDMQIVARLGKAKSLLLAGKAADSVTELKDLAGVAPEAFTVPVYRQLALAAEAAGDKTQALEAYRKLEENQISDKPFIEYKISQLEN